MLRVWFNLFFILVFQTVYGQQNYQGIITDSKTNETLPYVNIGILNKGIGTVSNEEGVFHLRLNTKAFTALDTLQFSSLGYRTIKIAMTDLNGSLDAYVIIKMEPMVTALNEVVVANSNLFELNELIGYQNFGEKSFGYWKDNIALGGELATKIRVKKGPRKLNALFFEVFENPSDSVLVRVNIYDKGKLKTTPGKNLNTSNDNILHTIVKDVKFAAIDLTPYDIKVSDDFFISLELLEVYGSESIGLVLAAVKGVSTYSLRKFASLGKWKLIPQSAMAYHLNTTYFSKKKSSDSKVKKASKVRPQISGFIFAARRPISKVKIRNLTSNETVFSNSKGSYQIGGERGDILTFEANEMKKVVLQLLDKRRVNITMTSK